MCATALPEILIANRRCITLSTPSRDGPIWTMKTILRLANYNTNIQTFLVSQYIFVFFITLNYSVVHATLEQIQASNNNQIPSCLIGETNSAHLLWTQYLCVARRFKQSVICPFSKVISSWVTSEYRMWETSTVPPIWQKSSSSGSAH